jgi:hypothetical protein
LVNWALLLLLLPVHLLVERLLVLGQVARQ